MNKKFWFLVLLVPIGKIRNLIILALNPFKYALWTFFTYVCLLPFGLRPPPPCRWCIYLGDATFFCTYNTPAWQYHFETVKKKKSVGELLFKWKYQCWHSNCNLINPFRQIGILPGRVSSSIVVILALAWHSLTFKFCFEQGFSLIRTLDNSE